MPIYEYVCCECNTEFEKFSTFHERDHAKCPKCNSSKVKRLISKLGFLKHPDQAGNKSSPSSSNKS